MKDWFQSKFYIVGTEYSTIECDDHFHITHKGVIVNKYAIIPRGEDVEKIVRELNLGEIKSYYTYDITCTKLGSVCGNCNGSGTDTAPSICEKCDDSGEMWCECDCCGHEHLVDCNECDYFDVDDEVECYECNGLGFTTTQYTQLV